MGYICLGCYEEYKKETFESSIDEKNLTCPKSNCYGEVIEIDDMLIPIIKLLNIKGYVSAYCCSGHSYERKSNTYISFEKDSIPNVLPKDFVLEDEAYYKEQNWKGFNNRVGTDICIRKWHDENLNEYDLHKQICKTMIDLMEWAQGLN